jgi:hypothetical protein
MISLKELRVQFGDIIERERGIAIKEICIARLSDFNLRHIEGDCTIPRPFCLSNKEES